VHRSIWSANDLYGNYLCHEKIKDCISEGLVTMGMYSQNLVLHCTRVSSSSVAIGKQLGLSDEEIELLWCTSILHDIGKVSIPQKILEKPEKLTIEEYNIVKTHSARGCELVSTNQEMEKVSEIILCHHERFDGKGYPLGLEGADIPMLSRIISVTDAYDAMTSERPYRMKLSLDSALTELKNGKWTQFDGDIVECFIDLIKDDFWS
jgi:putative nucleotidyltransferase with HDIG domain